MLMVTGNVLCIFLFSPPLISFYHKKGIINPKALRYLHKVKKLNLREIFYHNVLKKLKDSLLK